MLTLTDVSKTFGSSQAVDGVSLTIGRGSFVGVIGRSGAGKSTLLRLINGLVEPSRGTIAWKGGRVTALRGRELRSWRCRCAMIFQQFNLVGRLDVLTNVLTGRLGFNNQFRSLLNLWSDQDRAYALAALDMFDMGALAAQRAESLSGGQQQRVAICRALVQEPEVILADEPVASLDPHNSRIVMDALRTLNKDFGITVVCNLHSVELARTYCDEIVGMVAGRVALQGRPSEFSETALQRLYGTEPAASSFVLQSDPGRPVAQRPLPAF